PGIRSKAREAQINNQILPRVGMIIALLLFFPNRFAGTSQRVDSIPMRKACCLERYKTFA
ncbi:hypothetical protein ACC719_36225, partial [Rhizobium ruizarguesonis]